MTPEEFHALHTPDASWSPALKALWHAQKGDWDKAHTVCQEGGTPEGAWVHAHLHREEGDLNNARHWYSHAGKPESQEDIGDERLAILNNLLGF